MLQEVKYERLRAQRVCIKCLHILATFTAQTWRKAHCGKTDRQLAAEHKNPSFNPKTPPGTLGRELGI